MKKAVSKKAIAKFSKNAGQMNDGEFRKQGKNIISELINITKSAMEEGKISSKHFFKGVNKEIDILSKMIESSEYTPEEKIKFADRISKLVDKLQKKDIIKEITLISSIGVLGVAAVGGVVKLVDLVKTK